MVAPAAAPRGRWSAATWLLIAGTVAFAAVAAAIIKFDAGAAGVTYRILFRDAAGLERGDPVTLRGVRIGKVASVGYDAQADRVAVVAKVWAEHAKDIAAPPNSTARIIRDGVVWKSTRLEIVNRGSVGESIREGTTLAGLESWAEEQIFRGGQAAKVGLDAALDGFETALDAVHGNAEAVRAWAAGPEAQEMRGRVEQFLAKVESFRRTTRDKALSAAEETVARGRSLAAELKSKGRDDLAAELDAKLEALKAKAAAVASAAAGKLNPEPVVEAEGVVAGDEPTSPTRTR